MRKFVFAAMLATLGGAAVSADVVIPEDQVPFTVNEGDVVRIPAKGIAGTQVTAKVTQGTAKAVVKLVTTRVNGKAPIGPGNHEVDVHPEGKGAVSVDVTIAPPNGEKKTHKYSFKVQ